MEAYSKEPDFQVLFKVVSLSAEEALGELARSAHIAQGRIFHKQNKKRALYKLVFLQTATVNETMCCSPVNDCCLFGWTRIQLEAATRKINANRTLPCLIRMPKPTCPPTIQRQTNVQKEKHHHHMHRFRPSVTIIISTSAGWWLAPPSRSASRSTGAPERHQAAVSFPDPTQAAIGFS